MLNTSALDCINSGRAWLFVGSGVSIDAGLPSWGQLVAELLQGIPSDGQDRLANDQAFQRRLKHQDYPRCLTRIEGAIGGKEKLETAVRSILSRVTEPGNMHRILADWPFQGYVTANYDHLLERAVDPQRPWLPVGNTPTEIRKVSGDPTDVIWHVHGSIELPPETSKLILTHKDYDDFYLDGSELENQLRAFLMHHRLVFVGFGFNDPAIDRLLRLVGRYTIPERPIYSFSGSLDLASVHSKVDELRDEYNVEVIPYRVVGDSHEALRELLEVYGAMIVRRSTRFGSTPRPTPSYDADTTGLFLYNSLVLQQGIDYKPEIIEALVTARVLSLLISGPKRASVLERELGAAADLLRDRSGGEARTESHQAFSLTLQHLHEHGLIVRDPSNNDETLRFTSKGTSFVAAREGMAARIQTQFAQSLTLRAARLGGQSDSHDHLAQVAAKFFRECIDQRSLGVAVAFAASDTRSRDYQTTALLQSLPDFMSELRDSEESIALIKIVQGVLANPSEAERKYIGLLLQGRFGVHILGMDPRTLRTRQHELANAVMILDSTTTIPLLAISGTGQKAAVELIQRLTDLGATLVTTDLLAQEVSEHAQWAFDHAPGSGGNVNERILDSLLGAAGERTNEFLEGFSALRAAGGGTAGEYFSYMASCGFSNRPARLDDCVRALKARGVATLHFSDWKGFKEEDWASVEELARKIGTFRKTGESYQHERQVKAEAEAVISIQRIRDGEYEAIGSEARSAYFVSNSRFLENLVRPGLRITMKEATLLQWVGTVAPFEESELGTFTDNLLWELREQGIDIIDRETLRNAFPETISASQGEYHEVLNRHRVLVATRFGVDPAEAFTDIGDPVYARRLTRGHYAQLAHDQERELQKAASTIAELKQKAEFTEKERKKLKKVHERTVKRQRLAVQRRRAKQSGKKKR